MKQKKKLASLSLLLALAMALTGCGGAASSSSPSDSQIPSESSDQTNTAEDVSINIFQFKVEIHEQLKAAIDTYQAKNPNVKINLETAGGGSDYGALLRAKFTNAVTIFNVGGPQDVTDWQSQLEDLSDQPWVDHAVKGMLEPVSVDGKVFALPYAIEGYGLVYNKEIFADAGIDTTTLTSYAKIEDAFKTLKSKIDAGEMKEKYPALKAVVELPAKETWVTGLHGANVALGQEFASVIDSFGAKTVEFKHGAALKKYYDLQADYTENAKDKAKLNAVDYAMQVGGGIAIERVAVIQQGNWIYGDVASIDEQVAQKLAFLPLPLEGVVEDSIAVGVPMYWTINASAAENEKQAAKDFLNWLYQSDEGKQIVINDFRFIPPFSNYEGLQPSDVLGQSVKSYADSGKVTSWVFMGFPTDWGMNVLGSKLQSYFGGTKSFEEVLKESQDEWAKARA